MPTGPPDKLYAYDLSSYTTMTARLTAINNLIDTFHTTYALYPTQIVMDSVVNAVYLGAY
jgi:hypothetical protein